MARKDRVPNPPKRVQAPQRRSTPAKVDPGRQRRLLLGIGGATLAVVVLVLGFLLLGGDDKTEAAIFTDAGCTFQSFEAMDNEPDHSDVPDLETKPKWNSYPPSSGPHFTQTAILGFYTEAVPLVQSTHNLEHGAVIVHYGKDVPQAEIDELRAWYDDDPAGLLVARLPDLNNQISLTAWTTPDSAPGGEGGIRGRGYLAKCPAFDEGAFNRFVEEHRYKGPERVPPELMVPGT
jgi:Protein of unknown function (DUF3105)